MMKVNLDRLLVKSIVYGLIFTMIYLIIVIVTTPNFPPLVAASIAMNVNGIYIVGSTISVAVQTWLVGTSERIPLQLGLPRYRARGLNILGSIASSFFSFFALIGVGCCGTWLFIVSQLPGVLGVGVSSFLTEYTTTLAQLGLLSMILSNMYAYWNLRKKQRTYQSLKYNTIDEETLTSRACRPSHYWAGRKTPSRFAHNCRTLW
jgi:hypothetical protein